MSKLKYNPFTGALDITGGAGVDPTSGTTGQVLTTDGSVATFQDPAAGGATNLQEAFDGGQTIIGYGKFRINTFGFTYDLDNNRLGLGTTVPGRLLHISSTAQDEGIFVRQRANLNNHAVIKISQKSWDGSIARPMIQWRDEYASTSRTYNFNAPIMDGDIEWTYPPTQGNSVDVLRTDGAGNLSWGSAAPTVTTTERNALAAANGMLVYNSTDNKFQGYENGAWVNLI